MGADIDPLIEAEIEAALWCQGVVRQAEIVKAARSSLATAERYLDTVAEIAQAKVDAAHAMQILRKKA